MNMARPLQTWSFHYLLTIHGIAGESGHHAEDDHAMFRELAGKQPTDGWLLFYSFRNVVVLEYIWWEHRSEYHDERKWITNYLLHYYYRIVFGIILYTYESMAWG